MQSNLYRLLILSFFITFSFPFVITASGSEVEYPDTTQLASSEVEYPDSVLPEKVKQNLWNH